MRLFQDKTLAVMIDMQDRLIPAMSRKAELLEKTRILLSGLKLLEIPVIVTQQYTKGLGQTESSLREILGSEDYVEKITFSCFREAAFRDALAAYPGREQILVFGVEAHVCVLQTVLDLQEDGYDTMVVTDCVDSRKSEDMKIALRRMESDGAALTTAESCLFELTERAGSDLFKQISRLVK